MIGKTPTITLVACLILSLLSAAVGAGIGYSRYAFSPAELGHYAGFSDDGWIRDAASADIGYLSKRGNRLELKLTSLRPRSAGSQNISIKVCGSDTQQFSPGDTATAAISLNGACEPRRLEIFTDNPYTPSRQDQRKLIFQFGSASLTSRLGIALLSPVFILTAGLFIFLMAVLAALCAPRLRESVAAMTILMAFALLCHAAPSDYENLLYLWALICLLLLGANLARSGIPQTTATTVPTRNPYLLAAIGLTILGALLRFHALDFGLPDNYHPDETPKANAIMRMYDSETLDPHYFLHPSLLLYCTYFTNSLFHYFGMEGDFRSSAFLAGRTVSATAGSLSILLLFLAGSRLFDRRTGLYAAALLSVLPLHVTCSRYLKEDSLLVFFTLSCLLMVLKAVQDKRPLYIYAAAILAGLSASTKYTGALNLAILLYSPWLSSGGLKPDTRVLKHVLFSLPLVALAFFCASPYTVLNGEKFRSDFRYEKKHMLRGHTNVIDAWSQFWMFHWGHSIIPGMTAPIAAASAIGLGFLVFQPSMRNLFVVLLVLLYYLPSEWVRAKPFPQPDRYILPVLPFMALAASNLLLNVRRRGSKCTILACAFLLLIPAWRSLRLAHDMRDDTRKQAERWLVENTPAGSLVLLDWQPYSPYLKNTQLKYDFILRENIRQKINLEYLQKSGARYLVLSSLFYDRYFHRSVNDPLFRQPFEWAFRRLPVAKEFSAPSGSYGFHNPVLTVFSLEKAALAESAGK